MVADFAPGADTAGAVDAVREVCPALEVVSKRDRAADEADPGVRSDAPDPWDRLTDRQREVLRVTYHAGYYDWPRDTTAEELADALGVASPTLHQHFRKTHAQLVSRFVETATTLHSRT